ncbi:MAG: hypothetical protein GX080_06565 [Tissierellia bacterium]|nr:hypothetical protein [Tissierellia bacterium]
MNRQTVLINFTVLFVLLFIFTPTVFASSEKTLLVLVDELNFDDIDLIGEKIQCGVGFLNIRTLEEESEESLFLSIALGRKVGTSAGFRGLYKGNNGEIIVSGFEDMLENTVNGGDHSFDALLGERLKDRGISYMGSDSSAIVAADDKGHIQAGEISIEYELDWLVEKTDFHLKGSNILVVSYDVNKDKERLVLLRDYLKEFDGHRLILLPKRVSQDMEKPFNNYIVPVLCKLDYRRGIVTSSSTRREGFIVLEDIYGELISTYDNRDSSIIGNAIEVIEKDDNLNYIRELYRNTNNLVLISYIYHGIIYAIQFFAALVLYRVRRRGVLDKVQFIYSFGIVSIFISFIMGISNYHINIYLYLFINLLVSYMIASIMKDRGVDTIGLFSIFTYGYIVVTALFFPQVIYKSYIGVNNLFYGARYYGFNNGMMGVFIASSIVSCLFIKERTGNDLVANIAYIFFSIINIILLSARIGANTGGFITASCLFLILLYDRFLKKTSKPKTIISLVVLGVIFFALNMYFDVLSEEKSHAISFLIRVKEYGIKELLSMIMIKLVELAKLTIMPPFSIAIISQLLSIKYLYGRLDRRFAREAILILIVSVIGFLINDTGNIAFIFMNNFLIALLIDRYLKSSFFM